MQIEFTLDATLKELNLTAMKFSELSGVRKNTILDMRNGKTSRIHVDALEKILNALNEYGGGGYDVHHVFVYKAKASE